MRRNGMRWKRGIGRKGFDDLDGAMVGRIRNCEGEESEERLSMAGWSQD